MSEKYSLLAEEEECFFLTSPFIEPDGVECLTPEHLEWIYGCFWVDTGRHTGRLTLYVVWRLRLRHLFWFRDEIGIHYPTICLSPSIANIYDPARYLRDSSR